MLNLKTSLNNIMRVVDTFKLSTRMFKTRKMRTMLTIFGIGIGIGAILFLVSLGYGLQKALIAQITSEDSLLSLDVVPGEKIGLEISKEVTDKIAAFPEVAQVVPMVGLKGQIIQGNITSDAVVNVSPSVFVKYSNFKLSAGGLYDDNQDEVLITKALVRSFDLEDKALIGAEVSVSLLASKITETGEEILDLADQGKFKVAGVVDDEFSQIVFMPISKVSGISLDSYSQLKVKVKTTNDLEPVRGRILDMGFAVAALSDVIDQANKIFRILQIILAIFGVVALVVSAIGMFNTMTIALMERTQEVGIMKSLGAATADIMLLFITEAVVMGFLGGVAGIILGLLGGELFNLALNILATRLGGDSIDIFYAPLWFIITVAIFSTVVGFLTGVWPARRASHLNPLEAVRYK